MADEQARLSEALEWVLGRETMPEKGNGLFLVDMPTGYGKSHAAQNHLGAFVANPANTGRSIFYITPQKKNLPDDDAIERSFRRAGLGSPKPGQVLRVKPLHEMKRSTPSRSGCPRTCASRSRYARSRRSPEGKSSP